VLKIRIELDGEVCEISVDDVTSDTSLTSFEWCCALRRVLQGMGFCSDVVNIVVAEGE